MINNAIGRFDRGEPGVQARLDDVVASFAAGYNHELGIPSAADPSAIGHSLRGFAVEGAGMSAALTDLLTLSGGRRLRALHSAQGERYTHLIHVGAGWAFARLRLPPWRGVRFGTPVVRWLAWDGWGFHQAFFHPRRVFERQWIERAARTGTRPIRDQGAGRALWFVTGADIDRVADAIGRFPPQRRGDLWAGIGLAASYTGAQSADHVERLAKAAEDYRGDLGQGSAFAAKAHVLSQAVPSASATTIEILTGTNSVTAAGWTDRALTEVSASGDDDVAAYQRWRALIRNAVRENVT